jgi:hypothetical protein
VKEDDMSEMNPNRKNRQGIELGDTAKDVVTGFEGVVVARSEWLNGRVRLSIQPRALRDGKPIESQSFDVEQCALVQKCDAKMPTKKAGGPMPEPSGRQEPRR